ncbi:MAG: PEP-CTERM sorting domain-containing protein [bacterium]
MFRAAIIGVLAVMECFGSIAVIKSVETSPTVGLSIADQDLDTFLIQTFGQTVFLKDLVVVPRGSSGISFSQTYLRIGGTSYLPETGVCQIDVQCNFLHLDRLFGANLNVTVRIFGEIEDTDASSGWLRFDVVRVGVQDPNLNAFNLGSGVTGQEKTFGADTPEGATFLLFMVGLAFIVMVRRRLL